MISEVSPSLSADSFARERSGFSAMISALCSLARGCGGPLVNGARAGRAQASPPAMRSAISAPFFGALNRARSHCRFAPPPIHAVPYLLRGSEPLFLKRQCDRILGLAWKLASTCWTICVTSGRFSWPSPRVRSHCRFRNRGAESLRKSGIKWTGGGAERRCGRALPSPSRSQASNWTRSWSTFWPAGGCGA